MASGLPVVALKAGGALDYVIEGKTGIFFEEQTVKSLSAALGKFEADSFNSDEIKKHAQQFSNESFRQKMDEFLKNIG